MSKKATLSSMILCFVVYGLAGICFADATEQLEEAETYKTNGDYLQAEEIYKTIVTDYAGTGDALQAQKELVILYSKIEMDTYSKAALDKLTVDFATYSEPNDVAQALFDIARQYEWSAKYIEANKVFQQIMDEQAQSWYVNRANLAVVRTNVMSLIESGKEQEAQTAIDNLTADFGWHEELPGAIYGFAKRYEWSHKYEQANNIYLQLVQQYPESVWAGKAPLTVVRTNIASLITEGQETEAQAAIDSLVVNYSGNPDLPEALDNIAHRYEWTGKYDKALNLYEQIAQQYPESIYAGTAEMEISKVGILMLIESGNDSEGETALDNLITDFNDVRGLAAAVSRVAEQYQFNAQQLEDEGTAGVEEIQDCLSKAAMIWERVINDYQDIVVVPQACRYAGDCYRKLGEFAKSAACYQKIIDDYPGNSMAWHALFMVGRNYEDLGKAGLVPQAEADTKITAFYEEVIEKYPDCKAAQAAQIWLDRNNSN